MIDFVQFLLAILHDGHNRDFPYLVEAVRGIASALL
jgi:hypothetical protein